MKSICVGAVLFAWAMTASAGLAIPPASKTILPSDFLDPKSVLFCPNGTVNIAVPHFPAPSYGEATLSNGTLTLTEVPWPTATAEVHAKLPNTSTEIGITSMSLKGSLAALFGFEKASKSFAIDYIKYRIEPLQDGQKVSAYARIGIGMRILVDLNDNVLSFAGTLTSLAAAVSGKTNAGTISAELIGRSSPDVGMAMPFAADLSEAAVQRVIDAMAVVKSKMFDEKTVIQPQILSRIVCRAEKQK